MTSELKLSLTISYPEDLKLLRGIKFASIVELYQLCWVLGSYGGDYDATAVSTIFLV
jgi:hypothetical protein